MVQAAGYRADKITELSYRICGVGYILEAMRVSIPFIPKMQELQNVKIQNNKHNESDGKDHSWSTEK